MYCPYCKAKDTEVVETRVSEDGGNIRRRRACVKCSKRFTTYERAETVMLHVIKKDGRREQFSLDKLRGGILKSCEKTGVAVEQVNKIVNEIELELLNSDTVEIDSRKIGRMVAAKLKKLDKVAYIRFASVFKQFLDVEDFEKELKKLIK